MNSNTSTKRDKRLTTNVTQSEFETILNSAISSGYSSNSIGRFIRDKLLDTLSEAEQITIVVPEINRKSHMDLKGATNNLNQFMRKLHEFSNLNNNKEFLGYAKYLMKNAYATAKICQDRANFLTGNTQTVTALALMSKHFLPLHILERLVVEKREELQ